MENALSAPPSMPADPTWPDEAALAAFRAWLQGVPSRAAVDRYQPDRWTAGASARSVIGRVKRQLANFATSRAQADLAATLTAVSPSDRRLAKAAAAAIEALRGMPPPQPLIGDAVERWLPMRLVGRAACGEHPHAGRLDLARSQAPALVGWHRGARAGKRPPGRGVLCPASRAH
jgi:hypothetical protein